MLTLVVLQCQLLWPANGIAHDPIRVLVIRDADDVPADDAFVAAFDALRDTHIAALAPVDSALMHVTTLDIGAAACLPRPALGGRMRQRVADAELVVGIGVFGPSEILRNATFFRSSALHCTATARILIPAECSTIL